MGPGTFPAQVLRGVSIQDKDRGSYKVRGLGFYGVARQAGGFNKVRAVLDSPCNEHSLL